MRMRSRILTFVLIALGWLVIPATAQPYGQPRYPDRNSGVDVDVSIFYNSLSPYGDWVEMPEYGWGFAPRVERGWRPYTRGQWVMTDDGWYWDSAEDFGWAAYHYGRWIDDPYYGWIWVPGNEWAPAWVSWRHGDGYIGWAPLPPRAGWSARVGLSIGGLDIDAFIGERDYSFVPARSFLDRGVYQRVVPQTQNITIINRTTNITNYTVINNRVVNRGVEVNNVEREVGRKVPRVRTVDVRQVNEVRGGGQRAGEVAVFRPQIKAAPDKKPAQGRSLVKGEQPPPRLAEQRKEREQQRRQQPKAEVSAKEAAQQGGNDRPRARDQEPQTPRRDAREEPQRNPRPNVQKTPTPAPTQQPERVNRERRPQTPEPTAKPDNPRDRVERDRRQPTPEPTQQPERVNRERRPQTPEPTAKPDNPRDRVERDRRPATPSPKPENDRVQRDRPTPPPQHDQQADQERERARRQRDADAEKRARDAQSDQRNKDRQQPTPAPGRRPTPAPTKKPTPPPSHKPTPAPTESPSKH